MLPIPPHGRFTSLMFFFVGIPMVLLIWLFDASRTVGYSALAIYAVVNITVVVALNIRDEKAERS